MQLLRIVALAVGVALLYGATAPLHAGGGTVPYEDTKRGFSMRVPDSFKQNPPKPAGDPKYQAASFYDEQAKYKSSGSTNPEFNITWWVTPKVATTPGTAKPEAEGDKPPEPMKRPTTSEMEDMFGPKSIDELMDGLIERNTQLFGSAVPPMAERWASAKSGKTTKQKIEFKYLDINASKPKKGGPVWYLFVAKMQIERPTESIEIAFQGNCACEFADKLGPAFLNVVKSIETREVSGSTNRREEVPTDPEKYLEFLKKTKLVPGWKFMTSPKRQYALIYAEEVNEKLVKDIAEQIESLRGQVYETVFPPDRPITAISVIRVCKDREQYVGYGAPSRSAGYWSSWDGELVFYEDMANKKDSLRVLYHEAFHQYIFYSVGACSPHSWFNEGHGDYFYGHNFKDGKWELGKSLERTGTAAEAKRAGRVPPLKDWLHWGQDKYYARTQQALSIYDNYALGWDFVYFLRTTKKKEYQGILDRYFNTLKAKVTAAHDARVKAYEKAKAAGEDPEPLTAKDEEIANRMEDDKWLEAAIAEGFKGVDLEQLHKDWTGTMQ